MTLKAMKLLTVCLSVPAVFLLHTHFLRLWYDESVQLSASHSSHPETLDAYRYEVDPASAIVYNQNYNMDPGGYTLFVNLMSPVVGNRFHLYRMLNISAFILGLALVVRRVSAWNGVDVPFVDSLTGSSLYLLLATFIFQIPDPGSPYPELKRWIPLATLFRSGFSIRAYGFEFLSISLMIHAIDHHRKGPTSLHLAVASAILFGLSTRYDFSFFLFAFLAAVAYVTVREGTLGKTLSSPSAWLVAASALLGLLLVYMFAYSQQMGGGQEPGKMNYLAYAYLDHPSKVMLALQDGRNALGLVLFLIAAWRVLSSRQTFIELIYVILFVVYLTLSVLGYHPFGFGLDRCLGAVVVFDLLALHYAFAVVRSTGASHLGPFIWLKGLFRKYGMATPLIGAAFSISLLHRSYKQYGGTPFIPAMTSTQYLCFDSTMSRHTGATVFLDRWATPNVKAFYEFRARPMPSNTYVTESVGPHSHRAGVKRLSLDQRSRFMDGVVYDFLLIPDLIFRSNSVKSKMGGADFEPIRCESKFDVERARTNFNRGERPSFFRRKSGASSGKTLD